MIDLAFFKNEESVGKWFTPQFTLLLGISIFCCQKISETHIKDEQHEVKCG